MELAWKNPQLVMIHTNARFIFPVGEDRSSYEEFFQKDLLTSSPVCQGRSNIQITLNCCTIMSTVCIRKTFLEKIHLLDEETSPCDDLDLYVKLGQARAEIGFVPEICGDYRLHRKSLSNNNLLVNRAEIRVLEKALTSKLRLSDRNNIEFYLRRARRRYARQCFEFGCFDEALSHYKKLSLGNDSDIQSWVYRLGLQYGKPQWLVQAKQIRKYLL